MIPPIVLVAALALRSRFLLIFIHVITGGAWTGFDLFMGRYLAILDGKLGGRTGERRDRPGDHELDISRLSR